MPSEQQRVRRALSDIIENIDLAAQFVSGMDAERLAQDRMRLYALVRCLEIVSEASRRLPPEIRDEHSETPWSRIAAAGNIYRHEYDRVSDDMIWLTVTRDLPRLRLAMAAALAKTATTVSQAGPP